MPGNAVKDTENQRLYNRLGGKYRLQTLFVGSKDSGTMKIYPDHKVNWVIEGENPEVVSGKFTLFPVTATEGILKLRIDGEGSLFSPAYAYYTYAWYPDLYPGCLDLKRYDEESEKRFWKKH